MNTLHIRATANQLLNPLDRAIFGFTGPISIGTPATTYKVIYDTGSCPLWVYGHDRSNSTTYIRGSPAPQILYFDGTVVDGVLASDVVRVQDINITSYDFVSATQVSPIEQREIGVFGLCHRAVGTNSSVFSITAQGKGLLDHPYFTFTSSHNGLGAQISFGHNATNVTSWLRVDENAYHWQTKCRSVQVGSYVNETPFSMMFDTGSTLSILPLSLTDNLAKVLLMDSYVVPGATNLTLYRAPACKQITTQLFFNFTDARISIPGDKLTFYQGGYCFATFVGADISYGIMGVSLMKNYVTTFDITGNRIGFGAMDGSGVEEIYVEKNETHISTLVIAIVLGVAFLLSIICSIAVCCLRSRRRMTAQV